MLRQPCAHIPHIVDHRCVSRQYTANSLTSTTVTFLGPMVFSDDLIRDVGYLIAHVVRSSAPALGAFFASFQIPKTISTYERPAPALLFLTSCVDAAKYTNLLMDSVAFNQTFSDLNLLMRLQYGPDVLAGLNITDPNTPFAVSPYIDLSNSSAVSASRSLLMEFNLTLFGNLFLKKFGRKMKTCAVPLTGNWSHYTAPAQHGPSLAAGMASWGAVLVVVGVGVCMTY